MKWVWWIIILIAGTFYIYDNYTSISSSPSMIDTIIITSFVVIIFLPLVSEIIFMGMEIKKELNETKKDVKSDISSLRTEIVMMSINNSYRNEIHIDNARTPSKEEVEEKTKKSEISEIKLKAEKNKFGDTRMEKKNLYNDYSVSEEQDFLFKTRYAIEWMVNEISKKHRLSSQFNLNKQIKMIKYLNVISEDLVDSIHKVVGICNRGIHGEIVDKKYIEYIKVVMEEISLGLSKA